MHRALAILLGAALGCAALGPDRGPEIQAALRDLANGGFEFEADLAYQIDRYVVCDGFSCTELRVIRGRRTILIATDAFESPGRLRASLLDIWGRYQQPHAPSTADQAKSALRIVRHGAEVGVDRRLRQEAHHGYRQLYAHLSAQERERFPPPDDLVYP